MVCKLLANKVKLARVVLVGVFLMATSWVVESLFDSWASGDSFLVELLRPSPRDFATRTLFIGVLILFLIYIARIVRRFEEQGELLEEALLAAKTEKTRSDAILEAVGDAISIQDPDYHIVYQNEAHKELLGNHEGEICYQAYQTRTSPCPGCHIARSLRDGLTHKKEMKRLTVRGPAYLEMISTPLRDGTGKIVAGIEAVRDVTERRRAEMEIKRMNEELEHHATDLAAMNRDLEAFSYSLSHDLRTYITRISTAQQILGERGHDEETRYVVQSIADSCAGMDELIEAMLTLSQVSHKEMEWDTVDLSSLAQEILLRLTQHDPEHRATVEVQPGLVARGDRQLLKIALENLLGNAWKYTRGVEAPHVWFGLCARGGKLFYCVRDNGVGFNMAEEALLFKPFRRLQSASGYQGNGVGLATVQRVIQRHGGEVRGESEPGHGAVFYFTLPG